MARPDGRIEQGQRIGSAISARAWNRAQDAADIVLGVRPGANAGPLSYPRQSFTWMHCRNVAWYGATKYYGTNYDIPRWCPVWFYDPVNYPTDPANATSFEDQVVLEGYVALDQPSARNDLQVWGIALEPIPVGSIGKVAVSGIVQAKVELVSTAHKYVRPRRETTILETATAGEGKILWIDPRRFQNASALRWAVVQVGTECYPFVTVSWSGGTWEVGETKVLGDPSAQPYDGQIGRAHV